jgi:hypothetical protein
MNEVLLNEWSTCSLTSSWGSSCRHFRSAKRNPCIRTNEESWCSYRSGRSVLQLFAAHSLIFQGKGGGRGSGFSLQVGQQSFRV